MKEILMQTIQTKLTHLNKLIEEASIVTIVEMKQTICDVKAVKKLFLEYIVDIITIMMT